MLRPRCLLLLIVLLACWGNVQGGTPSVSAKRWELPIPFTFDDQYKEENKDRVRSIIQRIKDNTCIDFEENLSGPQLEYKMNFVVTDTCYSNGVGDSRGIFGTNHYVSMRENCNKPYEIMHETMHALGFMHTHQRADRDNYVDVDENVKESENYYKLTSEETIDYGIPYEHSSIMHYKDDNDMQAKDRDYAGGMGGYDMTFNDWKLLNLHYKCNETCPNRIVCQHGGYQHPDHCEQCVCPRFFSGQNCQDEREVIALIPGQPKKLDEGWHLTDAFYDGMDQHSFDAYNSTIARIIKAPEGTRIRVTINNINGRDEGYGRCTDRALEIVDDGDLTKIGKRFCVSSSNGHSFVSATNVIGHIVYALPGLDFTANVTFTVEGSATLPDAENPLIPTIVETVTEPHPPATSEVSVPTTEEVHVGMMICKCVNGEVECVLNPEADKTASYPLFQTRCICNTVTGESEKCKLVVIS